MITATDVAKQNHPNMNDSLQEMIAQDMDVYAGNVATVILGLKTTGEVKKYLKGLIEVGQVAEAQITERIKQSASVPKSAPKKARR